MPGTKTWAVDVRMSFTKTGMAKFISHLDTVRCFTRAIKRAGIPIWFTEGYNPRAFMAFTMPLSLGFESLCETADFRLMEEMDFQEVTDRLNVALPPDIRVKEIALPVFDPAEIRYADYEITFNNADDEFISHAEGVLSADKILVMKKGKKGTKKVEKEVDIKEHIIKYSLENIGNKVKLNVLLSSGPSMNINPMLLIGAITKGTSVDEQDTDILKINSYTTNMEIFK